MKNIINLSICLLLLLGCKNEKQKKVDHSEHTMEVQEVEQPKKVLSPHTYAMQMISDAHVHIDYSSPRVRDRIIFGGLVAYDQVWQTGAHKATWLETNKDLSIGDNLLKAGKYGFFTIPGKEDWTVIFNKNWDQHGKDEYDEKDDVLRFNVTPELLETIQEELKYEVLNIDGTEGEIVFSWEKVKISIPFSTKQYN